MTSRIFKRQATEHIQPALSSHVFRYRGLLPKSHFAAAAYLAVWMLCISLLGAGFSSANAADGAPHYQVRVAVANDLSHLSVSTTILLGTQQDVVEFILNKSAAIKDTEANGKPIGFEFLTEAKAPNIFIGSGRTLRLQCPKASPPCTLLVSYIIPLDAINYLENGAQLQRVETGLYTAWLPLPADLHPFTYEISLSAPSHLEPIANGQVSRGPNGWTFTQNLATNDPVFFLGRDLKTERYEIADSVLIIGHFGLLEEQRSQMAKNIKSLLAAQLDMLGRPADGGRDHTFVFTPRREGASYSRPGFAVIKRVDPENLIRTIAHEIAHFWWHGAPTATWEDWLNESFAEYTAWMALEKVFGAADLQRRVAQNRPAATDVPPVMGIERTSKDARTVLYKKGPLHLHDLREKMTTDTFLAFERALIAERPYNTSEMLQLLRSKFSPAFADALHMDLQGNSKHPKK